ncbi:MAG: hypothetical protein LBT58_01980 [Endomicrobium sp.]|jgi:glycine cleavage system regulatory protein|nr:hypothetical protein [Endomicrobium sp.]
MAKCISLTAIGKNRHGLVSAVAKVLYEEKCNIEDSKRLFFTGNLPWF